MPSSWPPDFTVSQTLNFSRDFPFLRPEDCGPDLSEFCVEYNCIAWSVEDKENWWWPDDPEIGYGYWPSGVAREVTISAFAEAFATLGYRVCENGSPEAGFNKIALYALEDSPTHAARQLPNGFWTSKLGDFEDINHRNLECLNGPLYGEVVRYFKRPLVR